MTIEINKKSDYNISVNYQFNDVEIEGNLIPYNTGRCTEYNFEPSWFADENSEHYWDDNWEQIEPQILNKLTPN